MAITDCLNFGNPEKPEVFYTFHEAVRGLADACRAFGVPVVSGNVSFYNESFGQPIYPTPTVGCVGVIDDVASHCTMGFKRAGDVVVLIGETDDALGGSEYLRLVHETVAGRPPALDLDLERALQATVIEAIGRRLLASAHDCSDGGLAIALAECCIAGGIGADIHLGDDWPPVIALFSETQSRIVVSLREEAVEDLIELCLRNEVPYAVIGTVGGDALEIEGLARVTLDQMRAAWESSLERMVHGEA